MAVATWKAPGTRSSNLAGTALNTLVNGSESAVITYDNSTNRNLYGLVLVKLASFTPGTAPSISLRVTLNDGTDTADKIGGDLYMVPLLTGTGAKVAAFNMVRLYPFSMRLSIINNTGQTFASSGNELYVTPWNEEVV